MKKHLLLILTFLIILIIPTATAKTTISVSTPTIEVNEANVVANDIITVGESGTYILISTSTYHSSGYKSSGYAIITIKNSYGDVILTEEMLRSKVDDYRATYLYSWNTSEYLQSDEYTFTVIYAGKTASVDKYIINVKDWEVTEYYEKEVIVNNEVTKYIERYNNNTEYVKVNQSVYVKETNKSQLAIVGLVCAVSFFVLGFGIGRDNRK